MELMSDELMYISGDIKTSHDMLSRDPNDIVGMYNFFFDARIGRENVFLGYTQSSMGFDVLNRDFTYALLSASDVELLKDENLWENVLKEYQAIYHDEQELVYLLSD
jgi:hypothetical protein